VFCKLPAAAIFRGKMANCIQCPKGSNITFRGKDYCWGHYDEANKSKEFVTQEDIDDLLLPDDFYVNYCIEFYKINCVYGVDDD
jgi:hypothetical protein